jgi:hypothetical protein
MFQSPIRLDEQIETAAKIGVTERDCLPDIIVFIEIANLESTLLSLRVEIY